MCTIVHCAQAAPGAAAHGGAAMGKAHTRDAPGLRSHHFMDADAQVGDSPGSTYADGARWRSKEKAR